LGNSEGPLRSNATSTVFQGRHSSESRRRGEDRPQSHLEQYFKDGEQSINTTIKRATLINPDVAIAYGDVDVNFNVEALKRALFWSAVHVKEGGTWKIKMLTAAVKPPPPKEAAAK
jgi:hypothetical protein